MKVLSTKASSGISECTRYMSSPNFKLSYRRISSSGKLVFSVSYSLSAGLVSVMNKLSFIRYNRLALSHLKSFMVVHLNLDPNCLQIENIEGSIIYVLTEKIAPKI